MGTAYDPKRYWDARLSKHGGLRGTGHISFGEGYNQWLYRAKERALLRALGERPVNGARVLDVGCGMGFFVRWYTARGASVTGVDISPAGVERLRRQYPGPFHTMDVSAQDNLPLGSFDVVNVWDVMYHIVEDVLHERALRFVASNVSASGVLLMTDRFQSERDERIAGHVRFRHLGTYERVLRGEGFELVSRHFLYRWLNRRVSLPMIDSQLGRFYFWLDGQEAAPVADNLSLCMWRRVASS